MLTREECEKACMYLLKHCYETDAPALDDGEEGKTYTFTPSGFLECEIFKNLIEEHFNHKPLDYVDLKENAWVWNTLEDSPVLILKIFDIDNICYRTFDSESHRMGFYDGRFYPINAQFIEGI